MSAPGVVNLAIAALVLIWVLFRQLSTRPLKKRPLLGVILALIGASETIVAVTADPSITQGLAWVLLSFGIGVGLAAVRAHTVRLWEQGATVNRKGTWLTALLWIAALGLHLLVDRAAPTLGIATLLLYFGIVIIAQRLVLLRRARNMRFSD